MTQASAVGSVQTNHQRAGLHPSFIPAPLTYRLFIFVLTVLCSQYGCRSSRYHSPFRKWIDPVLSVEPCFPQMPSTSGLSPHLTDNSCDIRSLLIQGRLNRCPPQPEVKTKQTDKNRPVRSWGDVSVDQSLNLRNSGKSLNYNASICNHSAPTGRWGTGETPEGHRSAGQVHTEQGQQGTWVKSGERWGLTPEAVLWSMRVHIHTKLTCSIENFPKRAKQVLGNFQIQFKYVMYLYARDIEKTLPVIFYAFVCKGVQ